MGLSLLALPLLNLRLDAAAEGPPLPGPGTERIVLQHDDSTVEAGKKLEKSGHVVLFTRPAEGPKFLTEIQVYGRVYGLPRIPQEGQWFPADWDAETPEVAEFVVHLCDAQGKELKELRLPYSRLECGPERWHSIVLEPTEVPEQFAVVLEFRSGEAQGVYVGIDANAKEAFSREGLPGQSWREMEKPGNWMVRAMVGKYPFSSSPLALPQNPRPGQVWVNPRDGAEMVWIPGGEFLMGSDPKEIDEIWRKFRWPKDWKPYTQDESPKHRVSVGGFWMYQYEVTVARYRKFCQATGHAMPPEPPWGWLDDHPIVNVTWHDAVAYCEWAGVRLPTEAEWEYAARGGQGYLFPWGNDLPGRGDRVGNVADEAAKKENPDRNIFEGYDDGYVYTAPVGSYEPNPFGVYDLAGNVGEWCSSICQPYPYQANDGRENIEKGEQNVGLVLRGGTWYYYPYSVRAADRGWSLPVNWSLDDGFRGAASRP
jgi:formylglycine-generating enzyme required for sulfatase activity